MTIESIDVSVSWKLGGIRDGQQVRRDQKAKAREYEDNVFTGIWAPVAFRRLVAT